MAMQVDRHRFRWGAILDSSNTEGLRSKVVMVGNSRSSGGDLSGLSSEYEGREGKGREGKGREGKAREGKGRQGRGYYGMDMKYEETKNAYFFDIVCRIWDFSSRWISSIRFNIT